MTIALKKVFTQISRMPANEQEAIAGLLEKELSWQKSFSKTQKQLESLASEAIEEFKKGKTKLFRI